MLQPAIHLSRQFVTEGKINSAIPPVDRFDRLPERVLQFGTGVLLRALPDYYIDQANRQHIFNGRVVVVKSTAKGDTDAFNRQDCLYTHCMRGVQNNQNVEENIINSSISRVLTAKTDWDKILDCARDLNINIIISNTTEVGIQYVPEMVSTGVPGSFPGKLLAILQARFSAHGKKPGSGLIILPTELLPDNGTILKRIVLQLANHNNAASDFLNWLETENTFCNTLVDRIVPGLPADTVKKSIEEGIGYTDDLMIMSELYGLWAIEGDEQVKKTLSFAQITDDIKIEKDITKYRELKLRLLNCSHSLSCGLSYLTGIRVVKDSMADPDLSAFITHQMKNEIARALQPEIAMNESLSFSDTLINRFSNPYMNHKWLDVTSHYTSKIKVRLLPILKKYIAAHQSLPPFITFGFSAYLRFLKPVKVVDSNYYGVVDGQDYLISDGYAPSFYEAWQKGGIEDVAVHLLQDTNLWDEDLTAYPGFTSAVIKNLSAMEESGVRGALQHTLSAIRSAR